MPHAITPSAEYNKTDKQAEIISAEDCTAAVIFAAYNSEGVLVSVSAKENTELKKGSQSVKPDGNFNDNADKIEVLVWDSLDSMKPKI